jgi:hypothetical protein
MQQDPQVLGICAGRLACTVVVRATDSEAGEISTGNLAPPKTVNICRFGASLAFMIRNVKFAFVLHTIPNSIRTKDPTHNDKDNARKVYIK